MTEPSRTPEARERLEELKAALAASPVERLKWRVLRAFGALPTERRARRMKNVDYLWCGLNLLLDEEEAAGPSGPATGTDGGSSGGQNASFDEERYRRLSRGEKA